MTLAELIFQKNEYTAMKKSHEATVKDIKEKIDEVDHQILNALDTAGIEQARAGDTTVYVNKTMVPQVEDWEALNAHIIAHQDLHLLERRVAVRAWRELFEAGELLPGTEPFEKVTLGKRTG